MNYSHISLVAKIWVNILLNHRHFGYNKKWTKKSTQRLQVVQKKGIARFHDVFLFFCFEQNKVRLSRGASSSLWSTTTITIADRAALKENVRVKTPSVLFCFGGRKLSGEPLKDFHDRRGLRNLRKLPFVLVEEPQSSAGFGFRLKACVCVRETDRDRDRESFTDPEKLSFRPLAYTGGEEDSNQGSEPGSRTCGQAFGILEGSAGGAIGRLEKAGCGARIRFMIPVTGIIKILRTQEKRIGKDVWRLQTSWLPSGLAIHASGLCPHSHWHCALDHHVSFCAFSLSHSFLLSFFIHSAPSLLFHHFSPISNSRAMA